MTRLGSLAVLSALVLPLVLPLGVAAPAQGDVTVIDDVAGDGQKGRRLDITSVRLANRDRAIVTEVSFVRAAAGDLGIWLHARGTKRRETVLVASIHRPKRGDRNFVGNLDVETECKGLRVTWDHDADTAVVRLPSKCFEGGDYGAVRTRVITEIGSDADLAVDAFGPEGRPRWGWSDWTDRG